MSEFDRIEQFGSSLIQHGPANQRVYLMTLADQDLPDLPIRLIEFARERGYTKVFSKIPQSALAVFRASGYEIEGKVEGYFRGGASAYFAGFYLDPVRRAGDRREVFRVRQLAEIRVGSMLVPVSGPVPRRIDREEVESAAELYRDVFVSYPFPIHDPAYLRRTMDSHIDYYGIWEEGRLISLASAEKDSPSLAAELTDFATREEDRGRSLAGLLLKRIEEDLIADGYLTGFTIARSLSPGMNITFARAGYEFGGLLWNNTQICGRLEPMNVWYRSLRPGRDRASG